MEFELTKEMLEHFKKDPVFYEYMKDIPLPNRPINPNHFNELIRSVIYQQISIKAGATVYERLKELMLITPENILAEETETIKQVGLTYRKVAYMKNLATAVMTGEVNLDNLKKMSNTEIIKMLTAVKGIGVWTAEMFLMFSLARLDVSSYGDLAIRRGFKNIYNLEEEPTKKEFMLKVEVWGLYSTIAHFYLWHASHE